MVKVIMGLKGAGKTKKLIELVRKAAEEEHGDVVCITKGSDLTYDIPHKVRLINASEFKFGSYDFLKGFLSGLHAGNYDITHIFIDGLYKILDDTMEAKVEDLLAWCEKYSEQENVKFTITISTAEETATPGMRHYL